MGEINEKEEFDYISTSGVFKTPFTLIILLQFIVGMCIIILVNIWYWNNLYFIFTGSYIFPGGILNEIWSKVLLILLLPLNIYANIFLFAFSIILFSTLIFRILNKISPPCEGIFKRGSKEWKYAHKRFWTAYFPIWLARALPLPWSDIFVYRFFGVRIGKNVVMYEGYVDPLLVEIGDYTMTSLNICIFSHLIYQDRIIIHKVKIGEACVVGPQTVISPGTVMQDRAVLGANSYTSIGQELEGDLIHVGIPVKLKLPIQSVEDSRDKAETIKGENNADLKKNEEEN